MAAAPRQRSLDVFRGLTVAGMILVNTPGNRVAYRLLDHAEWNGCTLADLVFPFFLFIVGWAVALARPDLARAARRAAVIFALGALLNAVPNWHPETFRVLGVLQRIALCYLGAAALASFGSAPLELGASAALLLGYWVLVSTRPLTPDGSLEAAVDSAVLGTAHTYRHMAYDPEGLLSTIPALAQTVLAAGLARLSLGPKKLLGAGLLLGLLGWTWSFLLPLNKQLWTPSYVLWTSGLALVLLAGLRAAVDGRPRLPVWAEPAEALGVNAIAAYVLPILLLKWLVLTKVPMPGGGVDQLRLRLCAALFEGWLSPVNASAAFAVSYVLLWTGVFWLLRRRGVTIKV